MKPDVSIVVLAWNNVSDLEQCVNSIISSTACSYQLVIVDNGSTDTTPQYLKRLKNTFPMSHDRSLKIIINSTNLGYAAGNNQSLENLQGRYTLFLNQDIVVRPKAIDQMVSYLDAHPQYSAIAPQLIYPDGRIQPSCRNLPTPLGMLGNYLKGSWDDSAKFDHTKSQVCEQPMASALMVYTELIKELEGFDAHPDFWLYFNDVDLCYRIHKQGGPIYFLASSVMEHHHGASAKKLVNTQRLRYWHRGMIRYFEKWYLKSWWQRVLLRMLADVSFVGLFIRDIIRGIRKN